MKHNEETKICTFVAVSGVLVFEFGKWLLEVSRRVVSRHDEHADSSNNVIVG